MSYCTITHQIYAISCNLTGRYGPPRLRHQYRHGLYRYDVSIHTVIHNPFAREAPSKLTLAKALTITRGGASRFRVSTIRSARGAGALAASSSLLRKYVILSGLE